MREVNDKGLKALKSIVDNLSYEIPQRMKREKIPGLATALVSREYDIWYGCFGYTDMSGKIEVNIDTLFCLQSTTKTVTTVAFLLAVQGGLVELDDPLVKHYPEFTAHSRFGDDQYKKITFRHLLSHSSGLTREARLGGVFNYISCTWEDHIESISDSWLKFPVGEGFAYSNAGMDLVAYALERITGKSYPRYIQDALGDPLGITFHYNTKEVFSRSNSAKGYLGKSKAVIVDPHGLGCGAAYLSIKDQASFVRFLLNLGTANGNEILKTDYINEMRSSDKEGWYGLGTFISNKYGIKIPYHPGGGFGLCSEMYWIPEYDIGVAVLANQEYQGYVSTLAKTTLENALKAKGVTSKTMDFPFAETPKKDVDQKLLERLVGIYSGTWGSVNVKLREGRLHLDYPDRQVRLESHSETAFSAESPKGLVFRLDDEGKPTSLRMYSTDQGILNMDYRGVPSCRPGPNRKEWEKFSGLYQMHFYGSETSFWAVKVEDDGYLHLNAWGNECLYEHKNLPNLFFKFNGDAVILKNDHLLNDNIKAEKIFDLAAILALQPKWPKWVTDQLAFRLKYLGRHTEAREVLHASKKD